MAYNELAVTEVVGAGGQATITVRVPNGIDTWTITQVSAELPSAPAGSTCELRKNGNLVTLLIPTGDVAAGDPPVVLRPTDPGITVTWGGCTPGTVARALVFYDDGRN